MKYDAIIITKTPNFYKRNLYKELSRKLKIHVVFIAAHERMRNSDFSSIRPIEQFEYTILSESFEHRNTAKTSVKLVRILMENSYSKLILGEWVSIEYWIALLVSKKSKTILTLESNIHSIQKIGIKEYFKKLFLKRVGLVLASGVKHVELLTVLNFRGKVRTTNGVGIVSYEPVHKIERTNEFLFVGRLSKEKNLETLVKAFNRLPFKLNLIGEGPEKKRLQEMADSNISFLGYVHNKEIGKFLVSHRALILISTHEPYGLVAEESLYFGTPVILSSVCGIVKTLCFDGVNCVTVDATSQGELEAAIHKMMDGKFYSLLQTECKPENIIKKDRRQIETYVESILFE